MKNTVKIKISTEEKILAAAEQVFLKSGYDGSRMQEIADLAGINKAMLHYYFRSKDLLFEHIAEQKFALFFPKLQELLGSPVSFTDKVCTYVELHINLLRENPYLPLFVVNTVNINSDFIKKMPTLVVSEFIKSYYEDLAANKVKEVNPLQFLVSVISMCVFPFLAKPIFMIAATHTNLDFDALMTARTEEVKSYVKAILMP